MRFGGFGYDRQFGYGNYGSATVGGTPTPTPLPSFGFASMDGDSRPGNSGGRNFGGGTLTVTHGVGGLSSLGLVQAVCGNKWVYSYGYQKAVGGSSSLGMTGRMTSSSISSTGNPANATTNIASDLIMSSQSDGVTTASTVPGNHVFVLDSVNDGSGTSGSYYDSPFTSYQSLRQLAARIGNATTASKLPVFADELPTGNPDIPLESHTVTAGTWTVSVTANFFDAESYGGVGVVGQFASGSPLIRPMTKVTSTPQQDQYTVVNGVYVAGGTAPTTTWSSFTASSTVTTTKTSLRIVNAWLNSSASNFTYASNDYAIPGAKFSYPTLQVIPTYSTLKDPTSGSAELSLPGIYDSLRLHTNAYGALMLATNAYKPWVDANYASSPSLEARPIFNNWYACKGSGSGTTFTATLPPSMRVVTPTIVTINSVQVATVNTSTGAITGANVTAGSYNFATGAFTITLNSATLMPANAQMWVEQDIGNGSTIGRNILMNGMLDMTAAVGTGLTVFTGTSSVTGISASQVPYGWALSSSSVNAAIAAGTLTYAVGTETTGDGYPRWTNTIDGIHTAALSATLVQAIFNASVRFGSLASFMGGYRQSYAAGPQGRMYGNRGMNFAFGAVTPSTSVTTSSGAQNSTGIGGGAPDSAVVMDDRMLKFGGYDLYRLTPVVSFGEFPSVTSCNVTITTFFGVANTPISTKNSLGQAQVRERSDVT